MEIRFTIDRFEGDKAVLISDNGDVVHWPKQKLPENLKEGMKIFLKVATEEESQKDRKALAKEILNEILNVG